MEEIESVGGSATSISFSADEEVLPVAPTPPVVVVLPKNDIFDRQVERCSGKSTKTLSRVQVPLKLQKHVLGGFRSFPLLNANL